MDPKDYDKFYSDSYNVQGSYDQWVSYYSENKATASSQPKTPSYASIVKTITPKIPWQKRLANSGFKGVPPPASLQAKPVEAKKPEQISENARLLMAAHSALLPINSSTQYSKPVYENDYQQEPPHGTQQTSSFSPRNKRMPPDLNGIKTPSYISVQKKSQSPSYKATPKKSQKNAKKNAKAAGEEWPAQLKNLVDTILKKCPPYKLDEVERNLKDKIVTATAEKTLWTTDWTQFSLESFSGAPEKRKLTVGNFKAEDVRHSSSVSTDEASRLEQREKRFKSKEESLEKERAIKRKEMEVVARKRAKFLAAGADGNPEVIDWDKHTIIGTCQKLEKSYLRLTSAPDPTTVRPLEVLKKTLDLLKSKWKAEMNYIYICDQFKSLRQDLTVQRIKSEFTVLVYETHARIALEKSDLGEYNQCQSQLKQLYNIHHLPGNTDEFIAYRILYMLHTKNVRDLIKQLGELNGLDPGIAVAHALKVRSALANGDYPAFFELYHNAPNMSAYLMDQFVERERINTLFRLSRAFRPTLNINYVAKCCGFIPPDCDDQQLMRKHVWAAKKWLLSQGVVFIDGMMDCKASLFILNQKLAEIASKGVDIKGQL